MGQNEEVVRAFSSAVADGNLDRAVHLLSPEFVLDMSGSGAPYRGIYHGPEGARKALEEFLDAFREYTWEPQEMIELGPDLLCVTTRVAGMGKGSGVEVVAHGAWIYRFRDGQLVHGRLFQNKQEALEAASKED